ncbi:hypothetical protein QM306_38160, partial [Burkholderia cenocepacia]|nr:hypothetical protein [Burkholderia cenocepacia]
VNGVLDFDDVGQGAPWLEAAFASFALSRDADRDDGFVFDRGRWVASLDAYAATRPDAAPAWLRDHHDALMTLFCLHDGSRHGDARPHTVEAVRLFLNRQRAAATPR